MKQRAPTLASIFRQPTVHHVALHVPIGQGAQPAQQIHAHQLRQPFGSRVVVEGQHRHRSRTIAPGQGGVQTLTGDRRLGPGATGQGRQQKWQKAQNQKAEKNCAGNGHWGTFGQFGGQSGGQSGSTRTPV